MTHALRTGSLRADRPRSTRRRPLLAASAVFGVLGAACVGLSFAPIGGGVPVEAASLSVAELAAAEAQGYDATLVIGADGTVSGTVADERGNELAVDAVDPTDKNALKAIARDMAQSGYGWGADQFSCLDKLWEKESGWNPYAENSSSGAYGIPQSYPGDKMGTVAPDWRTNPVTQMTWGMDYIQAVYSTPCAAWNQHNGSY